MSHASAPIETALVFGEYNNLAGVECRPQANVSQQTGVVLLTPGMLHHVGPFRLHVHLARTLAANGFTSLRFDLSGIGESLAVGASGSSLDRAAKEIQDAMDILQDRTGITQFVLFGLCSGADDGVHGAIKDDRVVGLIQLDGCGYPTRRFAYHRFWKHYLPRTTSIEKWRELFAGLLGRPPSGPPSLQLGDDIREFPDRETAEKQFMQLTSRGVKLKFIYTGGVSEYFNHEAQFQDMFPALSGSDAVSVDYRPDFDHVAFMCEDRAALIHNVSDWVETNFSEPTNVPVAS